jgi:hypothetical protein
MSVRLKATLVRSKFPSLIEDLLRLVDTTPDPTANLTPAASSCEGKSRT